MRDESAGQPALSDAEEQYRLLADSVTDHAVFLLDPDGRVATWNAGAERLFGYRQDEVLGRPADLFYAPEDRARGVLRQQLQAAAAEGRASDDRWHVRKDGTRFWVNNTITARPGGFAKVCRDLTESRRAEDAPRAGERRLRALLQNAWDGISLLAADGTILENIPDKPSHMGYAPEEYVGHSGLEFIHPDDVPAMRQALAQLVRTPGGRVTTHYRLRHKDGSWRWVEAIGKNLLDEPSVRAVVVNYRDLTEQRRVEESLRQSEARFRSVVDHVLDGIITINERGTIETFNLAAERLFGYAAAEVVGHNVKLLMPEPYHSGHDGYVANYLRTGQAKIIGIGREVVGRRRDGSTFPMDLAVSEFSLDGQRYFTGIVRDITVRKNLEQQLRERAAELAEADRHKNEFLALLGHELRNPLAPIRNALQVMRLGGTDRPEAGAWVQDMLERQVGHLVRLVDDLLDVSRISQGKLNLQKERVELATVVAQAVETCGPLLVARRHTLDVALGREPVRLEADPTRLAQVVANLLTNAAKYTPEGGHITLTTERDGGEVVLRVRDNGIGIRPDMLPRVFDLFTQAERTLHHSQGGLGIGLTLVKSLVEMHGGTVSAHSAGPGRGSEFVVRLPWAPGPEAALPAGETPGVAPSPAARRVLVVDDNVDAAESLATLLRLQGHEVLTVHEGGAVIEAARSFRPEVVLLDIGLPGGLTGYDLAPRLRELPGLGGALLVALTGYGQEEDKRRAGEAGFDAHLTKPAEPDVLAALLAGGRVDK
jgi:PAS domain S-box-containing protein